MANEGISWDEFDDDDKSQNQPDPIGDPDPDPEIEKVLNPEKTNPDGSPIIPDAGLKPNLEDDDPDPDPNPKGDPDPDVDPDPDADPGTEDQSGIELYLAQFDIEGGIINFEDGSKKHFDEIEPAKQAEILQQLHGNQAISVEEKYGLVDEEVGLINYLRENKMTVSQMIENMANERVSTLMAVQQSQTTDFDNMSDEAIYTKFLKESSPDDDPEVLETKLNEAKKLSTFDSVAKALRTQYKSIQEKEVSEQQATQTAEKQKTLDDQRRSVVAAVTNINDIDGVVLDDNIKNSVLDRVLEVGESGDSLFMDEVFSDPAKLFKAAFRFYYGDNISKQRDDYWKKEKSAAYKRGKSDALGKSPAGVSFSASKQGKKDPIKSVKQSTGDFEFDD